MSIQDDIEQKLASGIDLLHLEVINESSRHNVPPGSESHFKVVLVSNRFQGQTLLARHRCINELLADELANSIHALAIHAYSESEWRERNSDVPMSPPCRGGDKHES